MLATESIGMDAIDWDTVQDVRFATFDNRVVIFADAPGCLCKHDSRRRISSSRDVACQVCQLKYQSLGVLRSGNNTRIRWDDWVDCICIAQAPMDSRRPCVVDGNNYPLPQTQNGLHLRRLDGSYAEFVPKRGDHPFGIGMALRGRLANASPLTCNWPMQKLRVLDQRVA